jgi:hypothetical protein
MFFDVLGTQLPYPGPSRSLAETAYRRGADIASFSERPRSPLLSRRGPRGRSCRPNATRLGRRDRLRGIPFAGVHGSAHVARRWA